MSIYELAFFYIKKELTNLFRLGTFRNFSHHHLIN